MRSRSLRRARAPLRGARSSSSRRRRLRAPRPSSVSTRPATSAATSCPARIARTGSGCASSNCVGRRDGPRRRRMCANHARRRSPSTTRPGCWSTASGARRRKARARRRGFICRRCTARWAGAPGARSPPRGKPPSVKSRDRPLPSRLSRTPSSARPGSRRAKRPTGNACWSAARTMPSAPFPQAACCSPPAPTCRRTASRSRSGPSGVARRPGSSSTGC